MTRIARLPERSVLAVSGEDRVSFLQGLVSNDVAQLGGQLGAQAGPGRAVWAALLTPQGKWLADFFVVAEGDRLLLDVEAGQGAMVAQRLTRFRLRAKVVVEPVAVPVFAGWDGPAPDGAFDDPRLPGAGWRLLGEAAANATAEEYDLHRLRLGLPDGSRDMEAEKSTLLEAGFDELHGVSWTKGCYMGQELTARTKYRGLLKRRLVPVSAAAVPAPGTPVLADGVEVGTMRSGRDGHGLALLRIDALDRRLTAADVALEVAVPGWMALSRDAATA